MSDHVVAAIQLQPGDVLRDTGETIIARSPMKLIRHHEGQARVRVAFVTDGRAQRVVFKRDTLVRIGRP